jgi:putative transposase
MFWSIVALVFSVLLELFNLRDLSNYEKDLEVLILRHQLDILDRKQTRHNRPSKAEKLALAVLTNKLKTMSNRSASQLRNVVRIFQPETVLKWHRELVRRKWTQDHRNKGGRPKIDAELEDLIVRLAEENPRWGYGKIEGELIKLGIKLSQTTIRNVLNRNGIVPAPVRFGSIGWRRLMKHYREQIIACDFFTIETLWLKTLYVFFFIELGSRRVHLAGITANPNSAWVTQQARQFVWTLEETDANLKFLIHDRDSKFTNAFDNVFISTGFHVIRTPLRAPDANAYAERWVRTVREECLDHLLIMNQTHLKRVLDSYISYYELSRPHQGLNQQTPIPRKPISYSGQVRKREVLGGIISDYYCAPQPFPHPLH